MIDDDYDRGVQNVQPERVPQISIERENFVVRSDDKTKNLIPYFSSKSYLCT